MKTRITRTAHFNAAHRLHNPEWSEARNREVFGKCNNPNYHGHNYEVHVTITGPIAKDTGFVKDTKVLKRMIQETIIERFDHRNLNLDTEEFRDLNPTAENIAVVIFNLLVGQLSEDQNLKITLYETERNYVEYPA